ncbi:zinc-binding dehydrogenase [Kribbella steppae]|uniref:Zinc-binding dehydrogenase n=1 Tax=Kribbella steppae TaxID=2512223 RepID=A0A4R2H492_9ACTN|nr:zinc-binding dehydrogenase [Kribbella steppae]
MLADILPTGYEVGVLNGRVQPGDVVAVVGAGPIGLAGIVGAQLFAPAAIVAIDLVDSRLEAAKQFGATVVVNNGREDPLDAVKSLSEDLGADVAIEAVGVPATFELCTSLIRPGGRVANVGSTGSRSRCISSSCGSAASPSRRLGWSTPIRPPRCCGGQCTAACSRGPTSVPSEESLVSRSPPSETRSRRNSAASAQSDPMRTLRLMVGICVR